MNTERAVSNFEDRMYKAQLSHVLLTGRALDKTSAQCTAPLSAIKTSYSHRCQISQSLISLGPLWTMIFGIGNQWQSISN